MDSVLSSPEPGCSTEDCGSVVRNSDADEIFQASYNVSNNESLTEFTRLYACLRVGFN